MGCKIPEEIFTEKKPEIGHFHIFGCFTYFHVPSEKRTKLEATGERSIFVGYDKTSKAFHIYLPTQRKVVVRREVRFEERAFPKYRESKEEQQQMTTPQVTASQKFNELGHKVTGFRSDWVTSYRIFSFKYSVYREFW